MLILPETLAPLLSVTVMVAVFAPSLLTEQDEVDAKPDAHPCHTYVIGSPSGSLAFACSATEQG